MNRPVVTIGIPAFKGRHFEEALQCWKSQTFADFDVFVQDDCSPDELKGIFEKVCGDDPRFHYERNETGTYPNFVDNWHKTLAKADGEFFVLGSDDDLYEPNFLEEMLRLAKKYPQVDMFNARHELFNEKGIVYLSPRGAEYERQIEWIYALVCFTRYEVAQSVMIRTEALRNAGGFVNLPAAWGACDWLSWCKLARNGVVNSSERLMHWRMDGGNTSLNQSLTSLQNKIEAIMLARPMWMDMANQLKPENEEERYMVEAIRKKLSTGFHDWLGFPTYRNLPFRPYVRLMWRLYKDGVLSFRRFIGEVRWGARRALKK